MSSPLLTRDPLSALFVDNIERDLCDCSTPNTDGRSLKEWQECPTIDYPISEGDISRKDEGGHKSEAKLRLFRSNRFRDDDDEDPFEWKSNNSIEEKMEEEGTKRTKKMKTVDGKGLLNSRNGSKEKTISLQKWKMRMELLDTIEKMAKEIRQIKSRNNMNPSADEIPLRSGKSIERTRFEKKGKEENFNDKTISKAVPSSSRYRGLRSGMLRPFHHHPLISNYEKKESAFSLFRRQIRSNDDKNDRRRNPEE